MNPPQSRRADFSRASGGLDSNPGEFLPHGNPVQEERVLDSDDMAVGMYPTFARCSSLTVSVCLQVSEFDSPSEWAHFRQNHSHGFATHRDRRAEANTRDQYGWVPILLPCSFSCTYIV